MEIKFTCGSTSISLGNALFAAGEIRKFTPRTPDIDNAGIRTLGTDGGEISSIVYRNVEERIEIYWKGTPEQQLASWRSLNQMFEEARRRQKTRRGDRMYVELQIELGGDWYRSEILAGRCSIDDRQMKFGVQLSSDHLESIILFTRRYFWEYAGDLIEVPLNATTGGTSIANDASCTLDIDRSSILGDLPSPLRLELTNTFDNVVRTSKIFVGQNVFSSPTLYTHHLAGATTSNTGPLENVIWTIDLAAEDLARLRGNIVRIVGLMSSYWPNTLWLRWKVYWLLTKLWEGSWCQIGGIGLKDMGSVALPPRPFPAGELPGNFQLRLYARDAVNTTPVTWTWLKLVPLDGWRLLLPAGYGLAYQTRVIDDATEDLIWSDGWAGGPTCHYTGRGKPIHVFPGRDQRLYVVVDTSTGTAADQRTSLVKAYYRPRRLTL